MKKKIALILFAVVLFSNIVFAVDYSFERNCPLNNYNGINTNYGEFRGRSGYKNHDGIDYQAGLGISVYPVAPGTIITGEDDGWGKYVIVDHDGYQTRYAHLSRILVKTGDKVENDDVIGLTGNTGVSTGPHLHFSFGLTVDPGNTLNPIVYGPHKSFDYI